MINNTILLGKYIMKWLSEDDRLMSYVHGNIFPLIVDEDVSYPFIIYGKDNITPSYIKDGICNDEVNLRFHIVSDNYVEVLEIANIVRNILECKKYDDGIIYVALMRVESIAESFEQDAYIETINISAICGNIK